jgi:hypothetical protein
MLGALERAAAEGGAAGAASQRQLGATLAWRLGDDAVLHGWAATDADAPGTGGRTGQLRDAVTPRQWGLVLGSYPGASSGAAWALGVGRTAAGSAAAAGASGSGSGGSGGDLLPNMYELSLQFDLGEGLLVTPGMVVTTQPGGGGTAFLGLQSAWAF